jgi:Domain of unknown function (DUF929)
MGKASRTKVEVTRREKIAAQRAAARRAEQRRRILIASGSIIVVLAVVLTFVLIKLNSNSTPSASSASNGPTGAALTPVVNAVTSVPASTLDTVGAGSGYGVPPSSKIQTITGSPAPLTADGKPEMLYMGAEYCPYCAAERWAMIVALSRFGTFSGLSTVHSSSSDVYPNTSTWTFVHATYSSPYLTFTPVEMQTNIPDSSNTPPYTTLQTPTAAQTALLVKYDAPPYISSQLAGSIPFMDFGNKYVNIGADYIPSVLTGLSWSQIATDLSNPNSSVAKAVDGTANYITAAICKMTGNQPASACTPTVKSLESQL